MAISDRITSIEEHIKESYQELEGIGIDTTGVNNNLENIPKLIDGYWETLPKVTGEGTSITLDNTKEGKMKINLKGNTSQEGTPTPTSPQDIHVVSGDNSIEVVGKNLYNPSYRTSSNNIFVVNGTVREENGTFTLTATNTDLYMWQVGIVGSLYNKNIHGKLYDFTANEYTISITNHTMVSNYVTFFDENFVSLGFISFSGVGYQKTIKRSDDNVPSNAKYFSIRIGYNNAVAGETYTFSVQLEVGTSSTTYEAYTSESYPVNLPVENLFDNVLSENITKARCTITYDNGEVVVNATGSDTYFGNVVGAGTSWSESLGQLIKVEPSTKYTFSVTNELFTKNYIVKYNANKVSTGTVQIYGNTKTITTDSDTEYVSFRVGYEDSISGTSYKMNIQFEKGSKANSYTPYGTTPIKLCKIGTYQDSIKKSTGKNLINFNNLNDVTLKGVTTSYLGSKFKMNGTTNEAGHTIAVSNNLKITIPAGTYTLTFAVESGSNTGVGSGKDTTFYLAKANTATMADRLAYIEISRLNTNNKYSVTFTTNEATPLYFYAYTNNSRMTFNDYVVQVQLEKGTQDTSFEPYGTGWYVKKEIGSKRLIETDITGFSPTSLSDSYQASFNIKTKKTTTEKIVMSNYFDKALLSDRTSKTNIIYTYSDGILRLATNVASTQANFSTWLNNNNVLAYYVLATPTYTEITNSTLLSQLNALAKSYASQTNISQENNDLASLLNATALEEM